MLGRIFIILALLVSGAGAAHATATLSCSADDQVLGFDAMAIVGHGRNYPVEQFRGELTLRLKDMPEDRRVLTLADEHLTHRWLHGRDLKLLIFQEQQPGAPIPWVELVIQTRRKPGEDADSAGTYRLTVPFPNPKDPSRTRDFTAQGRVACSIG
jgi:hypothetical protein